MRQKKDIDIILNDYKEYLQKVLSSDNSIRKYKNVKYLFNKFENNDTDYVARNFLDLLLKSFRQDDGMSIIERLIEIFEDNFLNKTVLTSDHRSYLRQFFKYLRNLDNKKFNYYKKELLKNESQKFSKKETALINNNIYYHDQLVTKFRNRLRTQDRISGDKIWLPLRYIAKIYSRAVKFNKLDKNLFLEWLNRTTDKINVHYEGTTKTINNCLLEDIDYIKLKKEPNKNEYKAFVKIKNIEDPKEILTPTGKGNRKVSMKVKSIRDIAIDHVIPIDLILKSKEKHLKMLKMVSTSYKNLQEIDDPDEESAIGELLIDNNFDLVKLKTELDSISSTPLRLMAAEYNSQKSNGMSFSKIIIENKNNLKGILEEGIIYGQKKEGGKEVKMFLYQDLNENGITRIKQGSADNAIKFEKYILNKKYNSDLNKI